MALSERLFAAGLEQLSGNVVQLQADAKGRLGTLEQRLAGAEKTTRFNTDALDHAPEKIDSNANQRAIDQVEAQRRATQVDQRFNRLGDSLARLEMCLPGVDLSPRLETIEQILDQATERLKHNDPAAQFGASVQALSHRLEALDEESKGPAGRTVHQVACAGRGQRAAARG
jgi:DNA repair exonuclease SbcCD ATPase subunit